MIEATSAKSDLSSMVVVALALCHSDGRVLCARRPPDKAHAGLWEFPGGKVELAEGPRGALVREANEELGIAIEEEDLTPIAFADHGDKTSDRGLVLLLYGSGKWCGTPEGLEGAKLGWFTPVELAELPMPPLDRSLRTQLLLHLQSDRR